MNVLVIGASRGIGLELVRQSRADGAGVVATARDEPGLERLGALGARALRLDVADSAACAGFERALAGESFDQVWLVAGVTSRRTPGLDAPTDDEFDAVMHTNVRAAMQLLPRLAGLLAPGARLAVLSSRMGSIGQRSGPNNWLYRASKAALNSVLKDASLVLGDRAVCVALHPGWVRTDMGGAGADLPLERSVAELRGVVARLGPADNGGFLNHDGQSIPW